MTEACLVIVKHAGSREFEGKAEIMSTKNRLLSQGAEGGFNI